MTTLDVDPTLLPGAKDLPSDDGEPLETSRHRQQMNLLLETLDRAWEHRDDYYAGGNMFVYFSPKQVKNNDFRGPDVFVVLNTNRRERLSWVVWEEDGRTPDVVIELLSDKTEHIDRGVKMDIYAQTLKVSAYYLYDPLTFVLEGYALDPKHGRYARMTEDEDGLLPCAPLGLRLGVFEGTFHSTRNPWLRWVDEGGVIRTYAELNAAERSRAVEQGRRADEERRRADEERRRANEEKRRADALAARLADLKSES